MGGRVHPHDKDAKEYPVSCWRCGDSGQFWDEKAKINRPCPD